MNEHSPIDPPGEDEPLSSAAQARREAILTLAIEAMTSHRRRLRRRRRITAGGAGVLALLCAALIAVRLANPSHRSASAPQKIAGIEAPADHPDPTTDIAHDSNFRIVRTDSSATDRYIVRTPKPIEHLSDDELVQLLAVINRPAGVIHVDGRVQLTARIVDDPETKDDDDRDRSPSL